MIGVIHGDIKPDNVLVFATGENNGYVAKVTDFGYSTVFSGDAPIWMPKSGYWTAPEHHHRAFTPTNAKKMDAYSLGMLCLWMLWYPLRNDDGPNTNRDFHEALNSQGTASRLAVEVVRKAVPLRDQVRLQEFFSLTLVDKQEERNSDFNHLLGYLSANEEQNLACAVERLNLSTFVSTMEKVAVPNGNFQVRSPVLPTQK